MIWELNNIFLPYYVQLRSFLLTNIQNFYKAPHVSEYVNYVSEISEIQTSQLDIQIQA